MITIGASGTVEVVDLEHIHLERTDTGWRGCVTMKITNRGRVDSVTTEWDAIDATDIPPATRTALLAWARKAARRHFGV